MNVVFLSPAYPPEMQQYTRGLAQVGATVLGVGDSHPDSMPQWLKGCLADYLQVPRILDEDDVIARVHAWLRGRNVDQVLANWEPLVILAARLRERFGLPGMSVDTVTGFRDKQLMKERVAGAGLRVPRSVRARSARTVRDAAAEIGFPLILKPIAGAGSADTYKVEDAAELDAVLARLGHVEEASCEEYIDGEEFTYDTLCVDGEPVYENVIQYLPNALIGRSQEWVSPVSISVRDLTQPRVQSGLALGRRVLGALGMGTGFTHMEWFRKPDGEAVFGEIGCRPGGACLVDQMNFTSDIDLFVEWARVAVWKSFEASRERKYNTGICFKRARGQGRITRIEGLEEYRRRYGKWIARIDLLPIGEKRRDWKRTLLSDGHIIARHPDWDVAHEMIFAAATDVTIYAGG